MEVRRRRDCSCSQSFCPSKSWEVLGMPTLGIMEGEDSPCPSLSPLLQGPVPFMWRNWGDQSEQELRAAGAHEGWASPAPCTVPQPSLLQAGPPPRGDPGLVTAPRWHRTHRAISTCPQQHHCQGCGDEGAAFPSLFPSLPPSLAVPIPTLCSSLPFPVPGWQTDAVPQPNPGCHRKMALLLLPVLPPPLRRQAVPECERKLLRR